MKAEDKLAMLKTDLQLSHSHHDEYLTALLEASRAAIGREGIILEDTVEDTMLEIMYAAYLYRKRAAGDSPMPRLLRYALNNRLLSQKMGGGGDAV